MRVLAVLLVIFCAACKLPVDIKETTVTSSEAPATDLTVNQAIGYLPEIEAALKGHLQLYPHDLDYTVTVVDDLETVNEMYRESGGTGPICYGFYDPSTRSVVVPGDINATVLYHEVGHVIADAYFNMPVPSWLHEEIAEAAEKVAINYD